MKLAEFILARAGDCAAPQRASGKGCFLCAMISSGLRTSLRLEPKHECNDGTLLFPVNAQLYHIEVELRDQVVEDWDEFVEANL